MKYYYTDFINSAIKDNFLKEQEVLVNKSKYILGYLFDNCDTVYFTNSPRKRINFGFPKLFTVVSQGHEHDPVLANLLQDLNETFIKTELSSEKYLIDQQRGFIYRRYYYRISKRLKELFLSEDLIFEQLKWEKYFYTLEDPVFLQKDRVIANVITHEETISLYIDENDNSKFKEHGIQLESSTETLPE